MQFPQLSGNLSGKEERKLVAADFIVEVHWFCETGTNKDIKTVLKQCSEHFMLNQC